MSIQIGNKKATLCKGNYNPASLYKGDTLLAGAKQKIFSGQSLKIDGTYNSKPHQITINGGFIPSRNLLDKSIFKGNFAALANEEPIKGYGDWVLPAYVKKDFLKPLNTYTISFEVECVSVPDGTNDSSRNALGFTLYNTNSAPHINLYTTKIIAAGETIRFEKTFTLSEDFDCTKCILIMYTQNYNNATDAATVIFRNIQIEYGSEATEFEAYKTPSYQTLNWNGEEIQIPYILNTGNSITAENNTVMLYTDQTENISQTDLGEKLLNLKATPNQTLASISEGSLDIALDVCN